jgi:large subunit ribosomal protein L4
MKLTVYSPTGENSTFELPKTVADVTIEPTLLHQTVVIEAANLRAPHAHTKNRAAVRGGGRKPWKQKGTGRARASSIRSPLWPGGAVAFGLTSERNFTRRLSSGMRARAFQMALSTKLSDNVIHLITDWSGLSGKTKQLIEQLGHLPVSPRRRLLIGATLSEQLMLAARNLATLSLATADSVRTTDLLLADDLVVDLAGLKVLLKRAFGAEITEPAVLPKASAREPRREAEAEARV